MPKDFTKVKDAEVFVNLLLYGFLMTKVYSRVSFEFYICDCGGLNSNICT